MTLPEPLSQLEQGPIFIVGMPRSGTTWVHDVLAVHPQAACVFESALFDDEFGLGSFASRTHWRAPAARGGMGELVSRESLIDDLRTAASGWLGAVLEPHHRFLIEKTPSHLYMIDFISEVFPEAKFIHVLRDGRDVAVSLDASTRGWGSWDKTALVAFDRWRLGVRLQLPFGPLHARARRWRGTVEMVRVYQQRLGPRLMEVRYEDMHAHTTKTIEGLFEFCGMPYDAELVQHARDANDFGQFQAGESQFRRGGRTGDWRQHFGVLDRVVFDRAAGQALVDAGYEPDRRWWWPRAPGILGKA